MAGEMAVHLAVEKAHPLVVLWVSQWVGLRVAEMVDLWAPQSTRLWALPMVDMMADRMVVQMDWKSADK